MVRVTHGDRIYQSTPYLDVKKAKMPYMAIADNERSSRSAS